MKTASYKAAIKWIAENDSSGDNDAADPIACGNLITAILVADIFDVSSDKVGADIVKCRKKLSIVDG